jgi:hypothetical protein
MTIAKTTFYTIHSYAVYARFISDTEHVNFIIDREVKAL